MEDWYRVSVGEIEKLGGRQMLDQYPHGNFCEVLKVIYPDYRWDGNRFAEDRTRWRRTERLKRLFSRMAEELRLNEVPPPSPTNNFQ